MAQADDYRNDDLPPPKAGRRGFKIVLIVVGVLGVLGLVCVCGPLALITWGVSSLRQSAANMVSVNNMKQIGLALNNYHDVSGGFPTAALKTKDGKRGLSWRVAILPQIEQDSLYRQFKLDEPWDSPNNIKLLNRMPRTYATPGEERGTTTHYRVFVGNGALFDYDKSRNSKQIKDGESNTIAVVEAADGVPWTKPEELDYNSNGPLPPLGLAGRKGILVLMADGHVCAVRRDLDPTHWHRAIQYADGQKPGDEFFELKQ